MAPGEHLFEFTLLNISDINTHFNNFFIDNYEYDFVNNIFATQKNNTYIWGSSPYKYTHYTFLLDPQYISFTLVSHTLKVSDTWTYFLNKHFYNHLNDWLYLMSPWYKPKLCWGKLWRLMTYINFLFEWPHDHLRKTSFWNRWVLPYEVYWCHWFLKYNYHSELKIPVSRAYNPLFTEWIDKNAYYIPTITINNYSWFGTLNYYYYYWMSKNFDLYDCFDFYQYHGYKYYNSLYFEEITFIQLLPVILYSGYILTMIFLIVNIFLNMIYWCLRTLKTIWQKFHLNWILEEIFIDFVTEPPHLIQSILVLSHYRVLLSKFNASNSRKWTKQFYRYLIDKYAFLILTHISACLGQIFFVFMYSLFIYIFRSICRLIFREQYLYGIFYILVYITYYILYVLKKNITKNFHKNLWKFFVIFKNYLLQVCI